jgi:hypothetical protein
MAKVFDPYNPTFPTEAALALASLLRSGNGLSTAEDVNAAYAVASYGLGVIVPDPGAAAARPRPTAAQVADLLETYARGTPGAIGALPWGAILAVVVQLIQAWLAGHGGA